MPPDRDAYEAVMELVKVVHGDVRKLQEMLQRHQDSVCNTHATRLTQIELWQARLGGAYGAVATISAAIGGLVALVFNWLAGKH